ncbi:long-chain-fatty-acid--CoA ligase [Cupriavidus alkaliphilus]|uniref:long-chain-fatty-acid--CoA ligase n=1 Tax=Cupriavidus alkaliphilus TaxID=942866 RepID=UPI00160E30F2|nr:long-chain-fatty-acid--CoA ligase [Cupriavidus alkaliphilus]MBB3013250.1 long-chain acyl-CoA synthetase [Cupriavidus alkaliphilus]
MYMTQGLHRSIQQRPDKAAVRCNGRSLSYTELGARVARLAGALRKLGVADGERVAMLSLNSVRYIEYYMAVPWAGAVLNPVNFRWSAAEILYSLNDSASSVLIVDDPFTAVARQVAADCPTLRHVIYAGDGETPAGMLNYESLIADSEPVEDAYRHGDDLAGIFYTGGTTGFPKGVMLSHTNLISSACNQPMSGTMDEAVVMLHVMPMFHLACFASINGVFLVGGTHVPMSAYEPGRMMEVIAQEQVTSVLLAPTMIQMGLDWLEANPQRAAELDVSSLTSLRYGASPMTPALLARTRQTFPGVTFAQGYGMTELAPVATLLGPEYHNEAAQASGKMHSVGRPTHTVEVKVVDPEGREVPRGTVGEIIVRGPNVMLGYWNQPEATAEAIRNGWMHTGDGGYMDEDGFLFLVDRLKDMIISGGENVYSAEVEKALASHPAVAQSAVIGVPHEKWGESVHAVIVLKPGASTTLESVQAHCRERIAGYKIPRSVEFAEALPMSSVGKVLKNDLRRRYRKA